MSKKIIKLSVIRDNETDKCPFGLNIPFGCSKAGNYIDNMAPIEVLGPHATEEEKKKIADANLRLLVWSLMHYGEQPKRCKYAANLFPQKNAVDCSYGDTASGTVQTPALVGSPFYVQHFSGVGLEGLYSAPMGFYSDYNQNRNLFYGLYSITSSLKKPNDQIMKLAGEIVDLTIKKHK